MVLEPEQCVPARSELLLRVGHRVATLELRDAFLAFGGFHARDAWLERLRTVNRDAVWGILERVPVERMSKICQQFTLELLTNQKRLLE